MGYAVDALSEGLGNVVENPMILVVAYALAVVMIPVFAIVVLVAFVLSMVPLQIFHYLELGRMRDNAAVM